MSSISVCSLPRYCLVTLRPKITVILFGCPIVRLASSRRWPRLSSAARRWKMRLSQYSTCEKNSRCWQPACALPCSEEGREVRQPLLATGHQIARGERGGEFLQAIGNCAFQEGIGGLLESDALLAHEVGQPMVLIEADTGREWKVRADAHEHSSPVPVIDIKIVLNDPALRELEVPSVSDLVADGRHDARRFSRFEDGHDCVGLGPFEIRVDEFVTTALRCFDNWDAALFGSLCHPALKLVGDVAQGVPRHWV